MVCGVGGGEAGVWGGVWASRRATPIHMLHSRISQPVAAQAVDTGKLQAEPLMLHWCTIMPFPPPNAHSRLPMTTKTVGAAGCQARPRMHATRARTPAGATCLLCAGVGGAATGAEEGIILVLIREALTAHEEHVLQEVGQALGTPGV